MVKIFKTRINFGPAVFEQLKVGSEIIFVNKDLVRNSEKQLMFLFIFLCLWYELDCFIPKDADLETGANGPNRRGKHA